MKFDPWLMCKKQIPQTRTINVVIGMVAIACLWLFAHPYNGLWHDARLYTAQALHQLHPRAFNHDLFFQFGSQDQYSIFSSLYARAISLLGFSDAVVVLTFAGQMLWLSAAAFFLSGFIRGFTFWLALVLLSIVPGSYGYGNVFSYGEAFLTPRIYAEAAAIAGFGFVIRDRWWAGLAIVIFAAAVHPLMALPALAVLVIYRYSTPKLLFSGGVAILIITFLLAKLEIGPFSQVLQSMDPLWYRLSIQRSPFLALDQWAVSDWVSVALGGSILICSSLMADHKLKRLFFTVFVVSIGSLLIAFLGGSYFKNALLLQVQLWRALWLLQWFSMIAFAWFIGKHWNQSDVARAVTIVLFSATLMRDHTGALIAPVATVAFAWSRHSGKTQTLPKIVWAGVYLLLGQAVIWFILNILHEFTAFAEHGRIGEFLFLSGIGIVAIPLFLAARSLSLSSIKLWSQTTTLILFSFAFIGILTHWDQRKSFSFPRRGIKTERESLDVAKFRQIIPEDAIVYWEGNDPTVLWFQFGRSDYISSTQTAGIVFNKQTAIEAQRRAMNVMPLSLSDSDAALSWEGPKTSRVQSTVTRDSLKQVCMDPKLGFIALSKSVENAAHVASYTDRDTGENHYLYDCRMMRAA